MRRPFFHVFWPTAKRWADRCAAMGRDGVHDRSSRPHRSPNRTSPELVRKIVPLRWKKRLGPVAIGVKLSVPASTVHAALVRVRLNKYATSPQRSVSRHPVTGTAFVLTVIDDNSRVPYAEIHDDETAATAIGVLRTAVFGSKLAASGSNVCFPTTAPPTSLTPSETPASSSESR